MEQAVQKVEPKWDGQVSLRLHTELCLRMAAAERAREAGWRLRDQRSKYKSDIQDQEMCVAEVPPTISVISMVTDSQLHAWPLHVHIGPVRPR